MPRRCCYRWSGFRVGSPVKSSLNIEDVFFIPVKPTDNVVIRDYIEIYDYEIEAYALIHYEGLTTDEAAMKMKLSKATFWRILEQARFKVAKALIERKPFKLVSTKQQSMFPNSTQ